MLVTTPSEITNAILEFCRKISPTERPIYLDINPPLDSIKLECFDNVKRQISRKGGSIQYGWRIWAWEEIFVEAEFHSVWISPEGKLVDVTPADEGTVMFLSDNSTAYEGKTLNNIRHALIDDLHIREFIKVTGEISEMRIKGNSANPNNQMILLGLLPLAVSRQEVLFDLIATKYLKETSTCFCGSGKKYGKCHGENKFALHTK